MSENFRTVATIVWVLALMLAAGHIAAEMTASPIKTALKQCRLQYNVHDCEMVAVPKEPSP